MAALDGPVARPVRGRRRIAWLVGYPRSGNTWRRALLSSFLAPPEESSSLDLIVRGPAGNIAAQGTTFDAVTGLRSSDLTRAEIDELRPAAYRARAETAADLLCLTTHDAFRQCRNGRALFPDDVTVGVVYLMRNPLDVAVSWTFYSGATTFSVGVAFVNGPVTDLAGPGRVPELLFDWSRHVTSWVEAPFPVLVVRYEDMLADTAGQLARMARFLRLPDASNPRRLRRAVEIASFDRLRDKEQREGFAGRSGRNPFFRSGSSGDWRHHLDPAQAQAIARRHRSVMADWGYALTDR